MELFAFAGISNATILLTAASVMGLAAVISVVLRSLGLSSSGTLAGRVDRLEMRTASSGDYRAVISMASDILSTVDSHGTPHVLEMFEDAGIGQSWLGRKVDAGAAADALLGELKTGIQSAAAIARPIQNMVDSGSIEVRAERARLADDIRRHVAAIKTPTWDRHGPAILAAGVPSTTVSTIVDCFTQMRALRTSALALTRKSTVDAFAGVLSQSAAVLASASQSIDLFEGRQPEHHEAEADTAHAEAEAHGEAAHDKAHAEEGRDHQDEHADHGEQHGDDHASHGSAHHGHAAAA